MTVNTLKDKTSQLREKRAKDKLVKNYVKISMKSLKNYYALHFFSSS